MLAPAPKILQAPHPLLRMVCRPVVDFGEVPAIAKQMRAAAMAPWSKVQCIGLAANQVGFDLRIVIVLQGTAWVTLVNPVILRTNGEQRISDGCMSVDYGATRKWRTRPKFLQIEHRDETGTRCKRKALGLHAAVIAHEIDHLDGKLFTDGLEEAA